VPHTRIEELAPGELARYLRVAPVSVTGRRIRIPDELPFTWWG
jgi:hypothetical protein